jgi:hypothetical protein
MLIHCVIPLWVNDPMTTSASSRSESRQSYNKRKPLYMLVDTVGSQFLAGSVGSSNHCWSFSQALLAGTASPSQSARCHAPLYVPHQCWKGSTQTACLYLRPPCGRLFVYSDGIYGYFPERLPIITEDSPHGNGYGVVRFDIGGLMRNQQIFYRVILRCAFDIQAHWFDAMRLSR